MRQDLPAGTVTFLFTDIEGSTSLLHELGADAYAEALAEHRRVIREACVREGGVEVDTQGDAFFFAFPTAPGAGSAAAAISKALASGPVQVRVGLHTGTPLLTEEGYVGDDVHRAARIAAAGHGGQVLVSSTTAPLVELELQDLSEHRFKDLSAPERVFQLGDGDFPPLKSLHQTNLPIPQTPFLGREKELDEVLGLLERDDIRVLTLTGPGGTGKTRLAAQAAGSVAERFPHGVFWVPLAALRDPALVLESAGQALGAKNGLAAHIADKKMLLLFDNFEQVVEAAPGLSTLLGECPQLELLVTSREPLHLAGEQEYPVPPFAAEEGVGFFAARARAVKPDFEVDEAVSEICRRLDELPLALELAASRVKALSTEQILSRLEQRLPLLTGGARDAPERQRTLRATIEWSYDLFSDEEHQLFRRLSVFAGGCTLEAAEEVCDAAVDTLQSLVEKSLLRFTNERYWMLETIREYAWEQLEGSDEAAELGRRHAAWCLALAEVAERELRRPEAGVWFENLRAELDNLRAAFEWSLSDDKLVSLRIAAALWRFWPTSGYTSEAARWLDAAWSDDAPVEVRLQGLTARQGIASVTYDNPRLKAVATERLDLARATHNRWHEGGALNGLGNASYLERDLAQARALWEEAVAVYRELGAGQQASDLLAGLGLISLEEGDLAEARRLFVQNLTVSREVGNELDVLWSLGALGRVEIDAGAYDEASCYLGEALAIATQIENLDETHDLLRYVAFMAERNGRFQDAALLSGAAEQLHDTLGKGETPEVTRRLIDLEEAHRALGLAEFDVLREQGRLLEPREAVELALSCLD